MLNQGQIHYYDFYNYENNDLKFLLSIDAGKAMIFGTTYVKEDKLKEKMLEPFSSYPCSERVWGAQEKIEIKNNNKDLFCVNCHYLIVVSALSNLTYTIAVTDQVTPLIL